METEAPPNYNDPEEGEITNDDPEGLYTPLERPHISSIGATAGSSLPSVESDDENDDENLKESSSDSDSSTKILSYSKIRRKAVPAVSKISVGKKKNYNIWSSAIQTEVLTNSLVDCNVDQANDRFRDVESYNYRLGKLNNEHELKNSYGNNENKFKKQYSAKRRHDGAYVGEKIKVKNIEKPNNFVQPNVRNILGLSVTTINSEEEIARDIANKLCEEKEELICLGSHACDLTSFAPTFSNSHFLNTTKVRALKILGKEFIISLFEETKKVEAAGGMMVMNGTRRRTPGGVFFYLLKSSEVVPREKINLVLSEDRKTRAGEKKLKSKKNRQLQAEKFKKSLQEDDFPTLLSRTELAIKEFKARKSAEDSAEVKNPPPSPATDGKECSSDGEDQKEGNENNTKEKYSSERGLTSYENPFDSEELVMDVF